jgi:hypothetical protein
MKYDPDDVDYDLLAEAAEDRRRFRKSFGGCLCGNDMPGTCPGPSNCPLCQEDENV